MKIYAEEIRTTYELPVAIDVEVRSHTYNENEFWAKIKHPSQFTNNISSKGNKKDLLSLFFVSAP